MLCRPQWCAPPPHTSRTIPLCLELTICHGRVTRSGDQTYTHPYACTCSIKTQLLTENATSYCAFLLGSPRDSGQYPHGTIACAPGISRAAGRGRGRLTPPLTSPQTLRQTRGRPAPNHNLRLIMIIKKTTFLENWPDGRLRLLLSISRVAPPQRTRTLTTAPTMN